MRAIRLSVTIAYYCVFIAALLPYLCVAFAKATPEYLEGGNLTPREYGERLQGARKRAYWAHQNAFEAFPIFAAIVIIATLVERDGSAIDQLCMVFLACRVLHAILYIANHPKLRTLAWTGGVICQVVMVGIIVT